MESGLGLVGKHQQLNKAVLLLLVAMNRQKAKADNIKKDLTEDFEKNEKQYRGGIVTAAGVLYRKPRFEVTAKEKLEVGE